jgi:NADPH dehydrogenase (quinone)
MNETKEKKVNALLINAHQRYEGIAEGKLTSTLIDVIKEDLKSKGFQIKETCVEKGYDLAEEQAKHQWADVIITQSPVYWFGTPWVHKKYIDEVFTDGLVKKTLLADDGRTRKDPSKQYGTGGNLQGKKYMMSLTWNAPKAAFDDENQYMFQGKSVEDVFFPQFSPYRFCGVEQLPTFSCYDVWKNPQVEDDIKRLKTHLEQITNDL